MVAKKKKRVRRVSKPQKTVEVKETRMGRPFNWGAEADIHVVSLSLPQGVMARLLEVTGEKKKAKAVTKLIMSKLSEAS